MAKRLIFHKYLYLGESISEKKLDKLKKQLEKKPLLTSVYLIVPAGNPDDQLEFFDARQLAWPFYSKKSFLIIGIASNYAEAMGLIEQIVRECLKERGDCKLREYLIC